MIGTTTTDEPSPDPPSSRSTELTAPRPRIQPRHCTCASASVQRMQMHGGRGQGRRSAPPSRWPEANSSGRRGETRASGRTRTEQTVASWLSTSSSCSLRRKSVRPALLSARCSCRRAIRPETKNKTSGSLHGAARKLLLCPIPCVWACLRES